MLGSKILKSKEAEFMGEVGEESDSYSVVGWETHGKRWIQAALWRNVVLA